MEKQLEIISIKEARSLNPIWKMPKINNDGTYQNISGGTIFNDGNYAKRCYTHDLAKWSNAESKRVTYKIGNEINDGTYHRCYSGGLKTGVRAILEVGAIVTAECNEETLTAIII